MIHIATLSALAMQVHPSYYAQLELLLASNTSTEVLFKYLDYANVFLFAYAMELLKNTSINKHVIKIVKG